MPVLQGTYKNLPDGLPPMSASEKKEQDAGYRGQQRKLDNLADRARREVAEGTYMRNIDHIRKT